MLRLDPVETVEMDSAGMDGSGGIVCGDMHLNGSNSPAGSELRLCHKDRWTASSDSFEVVRGQLLHEPIFY